MDMLFSVGPILSTPMGAQPVTWTELFSWASMTRESLTPWESDALIKMSSAYMSFLEKGKNPLEASPADQALEDPDGFLEDSDVIDG